MKKIILLTLIFLLSISLFSCMNGDAKDAQPMQTDSNDSNVYTNTEFGFNFALPDTWKGYSIVTDKWEGSNQETGPMISIRHPQWTSENPRQDIPIMIFTINQWDLLQQEKFHIGAAPIGPSELGRNSKYVFALPARYNYAFPTGYEEVEEILKGNPLQPYEINDSENN